jgi:hypothetical protein
VSENRLRSNAIHSNTLRPKFPCKARCQAMDALNRCRFWVDPFQPVTITGPSTSVNGYAVLDRILGAYESGLS